MAQKQKNLLFVFADQWRRAAVGCAGEDPVYTPNMDRFAGSGVWCTNAVSACPLCSPHRASLFTGRHPLSTGVFTNCKKGLSMRLQDSEVTLGDLLHSAGYRTGYIGKWHLDEPEQNREEHPVSGARAWDAYTPPGPGRHGFEEWYSYGAWDDHFHPHYWSDTPAMLQVDQWSPEHETDRAIEFLQRADERPFALVLSWNPPHTPYEMVPQRYLDLYPEDIPLRSNVCAEHLHCHTGEQMDFTPAQLREKTRQYYAAVSGLDDQFGRLLDALEKTGRMQDTCIVLTADHGDMLGSHGLMAKHVWYEESVGIPLMLAGPGLSPGRCGSVIGSADVLPTLLDWLEIPIPASVEGRSFWQAIRTHRIQDDAAAFLCACPGRDVFLQEFAQAGRDPRDFGWRAVRTQRWTYVVEAGYTPVPQLRRYLYDLEIDPLQQHPLYLAAAAEHPQAQLLEAELIRFLRAQQDGFLQHLEQERKQGGALL